MSIDNLEIEKATNYLIEVQVPKCVFDLESYVTIDPFAFIELFHRNGVNLRHMGNVSKIFSTPENTPKNEFLLKNRRNLKISYLCTLEIPPT